MPYGDRTGPLGQGPRTGRGLGFCEGYGAPGRFFGGRGGFHRGRGGYGPRAFGGWRPRWGLQGWPYEGAIEPFEDVELLEKEANSMERASKSMRSRIEQIKSRPSTTSDKETE